ncbi:hypothetical protein O6H91_Y077400 [Diphasiastrum complanatum]|nr:hypothetical protein O6H91_Y077400 [Diphasiastrum complanatum]
MGFQSFKGFFSVRVYERDMAFAMQAPPVSHPKSALHASNHQISQLCGRFNQVAASHLLFEKQFKSLRFEKSFGRVLYKTKLKSRSWCFATLYSGGDSKASLSMLEEANINVEPFKNQKVKVNVEINAKETQRAYDMVLSYLARSAPPVPGFRKAKGGKMTLVPKGALLQMLGVTRVRNFVIEEIISSTLREYVDRENINAKKEFTTVQTGDELHSLFKPGAEFKFDAVIELEDPVSV